MEESALSGLKVIELSEFISGPYCGKIMADLGAGVIKIEKPGLGDKARSYGPFPDDIPHPEKSGLFLFLNTNKQGITLNIKTATGLNIFKELIKQADVLIEDHLPQEAKELGINYEVLAEINPKLITTSITPFGQTGPYKDYRTCDLINMHMSGEAFINPAEGVEDTEAQPPLKLPSYSGDFMVGQAAGVTTMSAVIAREVSGLGQHVDLSAQEALSSIIRRDLGIFAYENIPYERKQTTLDGRSALYECKDGYVIMSINTDNFWTGAVQMMDNPEWCKEDWCHDMVTRRQNWDAIAALLTEWTKEHSTAEIYQASQTLRFPCAPVQSIDQFINGELMAAREFFVEVNREGTGKIKYPGAPYKLSLTPWKIIKAAPFLSEHNEEVYCQKLGYTRQDLVKMRQGGII